MCFRLKSATPLDIDSASEFEKSIYLLNYYTIVHVDFRDTECTLIIKFHSNQQANVIVKYDDVDEWLANIIGYNTNTNREQFSKPKCHNLTLLSYLFLTTDTEHNLENHNTNIIDIKKSKLEEFLKKRSDNH